MKEKRRYKEWNEEKFFPQAKKRISPDRLKLLREVFDSFQKKGLIKYGTGFDTGNLGVYFRRSRDLSSIWTIDTKGYVRLGLGWLSKKDEIKEDDLDSLVKLCKFLAEDFDENREWQSYYPAFDIIKLKKEENMKRFISETEKFLVKLSN